MKDKRNRVGLRATAKKLRHIRATLEGLQAVMVREYNQLLASREVGHEAHLCPDVRVDRA
jgi:hypothetical protein